MALLARHSIRHWQLQQDTFWHRNLFASAVDVDAQLNITSESDTDLVFDQIDTDANGVRAGWINGANFYIRRPSADTAQFFTTVGGTLAQRYVLDVGVMVALCRSVMAGRVHCAYAPHALLNGWEWLIHAQPKPTTSSPWLIQLDGETELTTAKLTMLKSYGFWFVNETSRQCDHTQVAYAELIVSDRVSLHGRRSLAQLHFYTYYALMNVALNVPVVGDLLRVWMPAFALYTMVTM